jgi:hypothetical protein
MDYDELDSLEPQDAEYLEADYPGDDEGPDLPGEVTHVTVGLSWQQIAFIISINAILSLIISLAAELAKLARTLVSDGMRFIASLARSRTALAAENLFLRKQLAFYQERKIVPRRFDNVWRFMLVLLSRH